MFAPLFSSLPFASGWWTASASVVTPFAPFAFESLALGFCGGFGFESCTGDVADSDACGGLFFGSGSAAAAASAASAFCGGDGLNDFEDTAADSRPKSTHKGF